MSVRLLNLYWRIESGLQWHRGEYGQRGQRGRPRALRVGASPIGVRMLMMCRVVASIRCARTAQHEFSPPSYRFKHETHWDQRTEQERGRQPQREP